MQKLAKLLFVLSIFVGFNNANAQTEGEELQPNILFIIADDLRMNIGCYGDKLVVTPNLDRFCKQSMQFNRSYVQFPSCNASRASMLTGMRPDSIKVWKLNQNFRKINPDIITLPQYFKQHGYHTESIGKVLHNYNKIQDNDKSWSVPARFDQENHFRDYALESNNWQGKIRGTVTESVDVSDDSYVDGRITSDAVNTIRQLAKKDNPFFLAVGFMKPHAPFNPPKKYWDLYQSNDIQPLSSIQRVENAGAYNWFNYREIRTLKDVPKQGEVSAQLAQRMRHGYYAATSFFDANVGQLLNALKQYGLDKNTIVIVSSDHGYHLGENDHWTKVMVRELDAQVPLIIKVPEKNAGQTQAIVEYTDIFPTLIELANLPELEALDGQSFSQVFNDPNSKARQAALTQVSRPWPQGEIKKMAYSLRDERYRYTQWVNFENQEIISEELYDHFNDPAEQYNLMPQDVNQKTLQKFRILMKNNRE
ncbi:sulfatase [Thalassotalea crassostreae]|uniref:sulfatase n=1 Tax=Thalassotalea crassostreae TaxID=1763536 RepID=UPI000838E7E3|nr:sulfatase [Thalassotalea crassostreae]